MSEEREATFEEWFATEYPFLSAAASANSDWSKSDQEYARIAKSNMFRAWQAARQSAGATDCPHGVDDGACKQCYAEATGQKPVAWLLRAKNGMIRGAYSRPVTGQDYEFAEIDGDTIQLLYAAPIGDNGAKEQIERYQKICAAAYQLAGLVDAPLRFLDALSDAANGEPMENGIDLLPVTIDECGVSQPAESKQVMTEDELGHLRLIVAFCETLRSIEPGSYAACALNALRVFIARAQAKGE